MALATLILSCFLFYSTSKYFPLEKPAKLKKNNEIILGVASVFLISSLLLLIRSYDVATSLVFWLIALMCISSALILSLKLYPKWIWAWVSLSIIFILIDIA